MILRTTSAIPNEIGNVLHGTYTTSKVHPAVEYADGLGESYRTLWLLVDSVHLTRGPIADTYSTFIFRCRG